MARMHSGGKGSSGSTRPHVSEVPEWSEKDSSKVEALVLELHDDGKSSAEIGTILRDQHAVPSVKLLLGKTIGEVLADNDRSKPVPEDLMNLMRKAQKLIDHLEGNRKDLHNRRQLELTESKIRRLARYYKRADSLPETWDYKRDQLRLMVE